MALNIEFDWEMASNHSKAAGFLKREPTSGRSCTVSIENQLPIMNLAFKNDLPHVLVGTMQVTDSVYHRGPLILKGKVQGCHARRYLLGACRVMDATSPLLSSFLSEIHII